MAQEYIEREAAIRAIESVPDGNWRSIRYAKEVKAIPAADVMPVRHGRWARIDYEPIGHDYICSVCGGKNDRASRYCPDCGAKMEDGDAL